ncbi:MAG: hypothetical protein HUJ26_02505 [Planctomycetaceae bacterium]|nr:hypothetical protein [Planctomycetaceae bacterium]
MLPSKNENRSFLLFLIAVLLIRGVHIWWIPSLLTGMNPALAVCSKEMSTSGLDALNTMMPPLPSLLLSIPSMLLDIPPGRLIDAAALFLSLAHAAAFWYWLRSLQLSRRVEQATCLIFLFLPMHNGYDGLDSLQTLLAGTVFLGLIAVVNRSQKKWNPRTAFSLLTMAVLLPLIRAEYLIFVPLFLGLSYLGSRISAGSNEGESVKAAACCIAGLLAGFAIDWSVREWKDDGLVDLRAQYACWTFLDGMPSAWLSPEDDSEFERRLVGVRKFGPPAEYDYSLKKMILAHPGLTFAKGVLSIPHWLFQLGGRLQILPLPAALLALLGFVRLTCLGRSLRHRFLTWHLVSLILVTLPLAGFMLNAEYMRPSYPAMCVFIAYGILGLAGIVHHMIRRFPGRKSTSASFLLLIVCVGLEFCYFYSDAHYPDVPVLVPIIRKADALLQANNSRKVLMDPYSAPIDSASRVHWQNRVCVRNRNREIAPPSTLPPQPVDVMELYQSCTLDLEGPVAVFIWTRGTSLEDLSPLAIRWEKIGFQLIDSAVVNSSRQQSWSVGLYLLEKRD